MARYSLGGGCLRLSIEADQRPWCPELDGPTRVSSLQTGVYAGPVGSPVGQHRFHPEAVVREAQRNVRLYTPTFGVVAVRARAVDDPRCMVALWMIGYEDRPERSAEICVCEIFGRNLESGGGSVGMGLHPFGDPAIVDDFEQVRLPIDVREFHEYVKKNLDAVGLDPSFLGRYLNEGFSGGEKKRSEVMQMLVLKPNIAILDEPDSGLDIDAVKAVAEAINKLIDTGAGVLVITHYARILRYLRKLDYVHVVAKGRVIKSGGKELSEELEAKGYGWVEAAV